MKQIFLLLLTVMAVNFAQAQTCQISAKNNNSKVINISVNIDSLKGQTLVTTINQKGGNIAVQMAYEDGDSIELSPVIAREDSSEINAVNNIEVTDSVAEPVDSINIADDSATPKQPTVTEGLLNTFGLNEIASLVSGLTQTNGKPYAEYDIKSLVEADTTKYKPVYRPRKWKWLQNYSTYSTLELSGIFGKDFGSNDDEAEEADIDAEEYGSDPNKSHNYGGSAKFSQVFVYGHYDSDGKFVPNNLNFAWSIGALFAMDYQKDYDWSYDIMGKIGIQAGNGITLGVDALIGAGITPYAIYSTNYIDHRVVLHNQWCFKYGVQAWVSMNYGGNTYTSIFARLIHSTLPASIDNHPTAPGWNNTLVDFDEGSWQVGFAVGYKFGYNPNLKDKRLIATLSTGYSLLGNEKAMCTLIDFEKFNNVSPNLDFIYGFGYGASMGENKTNSFTLNGGWRYRTKANSKFSYLAKLYAGVGEYMVSQTITKKESLFALSDVSTRNVCLKAGVQLGVSYQLGCAILSAGLRGGYHYGFDAEYDGYDDIKYKNLRAFDLTPMISLGLNF